MNEKTKSLIIDISDVLDEFEVDLDTLIYCHEGLYTTRANVKCIEGAITLFRMSIETLRATRDALMEEAQLCRK